jgi:hypothetical protein
MTFSTACYAYDIVLSLITAATFVLTWFASVPFRDELVGVHPIAGWALNVFLLALYLVGIAATLSKTRAGRGKDAITHRFIVEVIGGPAAQPLFESDKDAALKSNVGRS